MVESPTGISLRKILATAVERHAAQLGPLTTERDLMQHAIAAQVRSSRQKDAEQQRDDEEKIIDEKQKCKGSPSPALLPSGLSCRSPVPRRAAIPERWSRAAMTMCLSRLARHFM